MRVRSFHAPSAAEALLRARAEMGDRARILATRAHARGVELVVVDARPEEPRGEVSLLRDEIRRLRDRLSEPVPPRLADLDRRLRASGVEGELRRHALASAAPHAGLEALDAAATALAERIPVLPPRPRDAGGARVIAFAGPTGVGKTTTLAKVAGRLVHEAKRRVALVTLDTYRIGAVEQLRAYADMLRAPLDVAFTPADLVRSVERHRDCDAVLVDTAGRSPEDTEKLEEMSATLGLVERLEVLLALPATASRASLDVAADRFARTRPTGLVVTKLDETRSSGAVFSLACDRTLPVAFLTDGQEVPHDLQRASGRRIAHLLLTAAAPAAEAVA